MKIPILIAELAKEHGGDIEKARDMIRTAAYCGFDAIKMQCYDKDDLNPEHDNFDRNKKAYLSIDQLRECKDLANRNGMGFWCSVFSEKMMEELAKFTSVVKIPSTFMEHRDFVYKAMDLFKEVHISTGMSTFQEIIRAYYDYKSRSYLKPKLNVPRIVLYHCTSEYPTKIEHTRLIKLNKGIFDGFSYHGDNHDAVMMAAFFNMEFIELHFGLTKRKPWLWTPDDVVKVKEKISNLKKMITDDNDTSDIQFANKNFFSDEFMGLREFYLD